MSKLAWSFMEANSNGGNRTYTVSICFLNLKLVTVLILIGYHQFANSVKWYQLNITYCTLTNPKHSKNIIMESSWIIIIIKSLFMSNFFICKLVSFQDIIKHNPSHSAPWCKGCSEPLAWLNPFYPCHLLQDDKFHIFSLWLHFFPSFYCFLLHVTCLWCVHQCSTWRENPAWSQHLGSCSAEKN